MGSHLFSGLKGQGIDVLDISKGQLTPRQVTINKTLSRVLAKLRGKGIIDVEGKKIGILPQKGPGGHLLGHPL